MAMSLGKPSRVTSADRWQPGEWQVAVMLVIPCALVLATVAGWSIIPALS
jgi:hypothetical protein